MKNKKVDEIEKKYQEIYFKANKLISQGNTKYAQNLLLICLAEIPELMIARNKLRKLQMSNNNKFFDKFFSRLKFTFDCFFIENLIKQNKIGEVFSIIETALCQDYDNKQAFLKLTSIAKRLDYPELVKDTTEYAVQQFPNDNKLKFILADAYIKMGQSKKAVEIMRKLLKGKQNSFVYQKKLQEANATQIIDEKEWESDN